jgi:hypothetical protein
VTKFDEGRAKELPSPFLARSNSSFRNASNSLDVSLKDRQLQEVNSAAVQTTAARGCYIVVAEFSLSHPVALLSTTVELHMCVFELLLFIVYQFDSIDAHIPAS